MTTKEQGQIIAEQLGLRFDGIQEGIGMQFTDIDVTGTTFYARTLEDAKRKLAEKRKLFGV